MVARRPGLDVARPACHEPHLVVKCYGISGLRFDVARRAGHEPHLVNWLRHLNSLYQLVHRVP